MMPLKPKPKNASYLTSPHWVALCLVAGLVLPATPVHAQDEVLVAPPVFVGIDDNAPTWKTTQQLVKAAEDGNPHACFQYAQLLEVGDQVKPDEAKAFTYYQKAALNDHAEAVFRVGKAYHEGLLGQTVNHKLAFDYYQRAAYLGSPTATYNVGAMLVSGRGMRRDYVEGLAWLMLAAERGTDPGSVEQVKTRLKRYPDRIENAAKRLAGIKTEIARGTNALEDEPDLAPAVAAPATPTIKPQVTAPAMPSLAPAAPKPSFGIPKISIPKSKPPPIEPEQESTPAP